MYFKQKPYYFLLLSSFIVIILGSFALARATESIDIHLTDTYFVLSYSFCFLVAVMGPLIYWLLYWPVKRFLKSKMLIWLHIILTSVTSILIAGAPFIWSAYFERVAGMPRRYIDYGNDYISYRLHTILNWFKIPGYVLSALIFLGFFVYILNLFLGVYSRFVSKGRSTMI